MRIYNFKTEILQHNNQAQGPTDSSNLNRDRRKTNTQLEDKERTISTTIWLQVY